ncbi:MAG: aminotransferase class V-fold PLP-dependent enzyme [Bdellovibrionales bacterium]|nr:aminotransferase class V-fold PLP-dependent enzyme [Oligoflexia bacterium]
MITIEEFKAEFQDREGIQFNNAGMAPISQRVALKLARSVTELQRLGSLVDAVWVPEIKVSRERIAAFLDAKPGEVALAQNCAVALSQAAFGYPLKPGDQVVTLDQEYASNYYPWKVACERSGASLITVQSESNQQVNLEKLISAIRPGVKLVALSWVQFQTGALIDLQQIGERCHSVGAFFIVDAIQGLGQLPFSFAQLPVDFVAGGSHKWTCSINGQGFFAVKPELSALLQPIAVGSGTFNRFGTFADLNSPMEKSARRFEPGGLGYLPLFALNEALSLQMEVGLSVIAQEIANLSQRFRQGLHAFGNNGVELMSPLEQAGGITSFKLSIAAEAKFLGRCRDEQIAMVKRGKFIRAAIHAFNREEEVDQVLSAIASSL